MQYVKGQENHKTIFTADTESVDGDVNGDFKILKDLSLKWILQERYKNNTKKIPWSSNQGFNCFSLKISRYAQIPCSETLRANSFSQQLIHILTSLMYSQNYNENL